MDHTTNSPMEQEDLTPEQFEQLRALIETRCIEVKIEGREVVFMACVGVMITRVGAIDFLSLVNASAEEMAHEEDTGGLLMLAGLLAKAAAGVHAMIDAPAPYCYAPEHIRPIEEAAYLRDWARLRDPIAASDDDSEA